MPSFFDERGNYCYVKSGISLSDTHGGHEKLHSWEHEQQINEIVDQKIAIIMRELNEKIPQMIEEYGARVFERLITNLVGVIETDINTEVSIAIEGARDIFYGTKAQKYITDNIMKHLIKELNKLKNINIS